MVAYKLSIPLLGDMSMTIYSYEEQWRWWWRQRSALGLTRNTWAMIAATVAIALGFWFGVDLNRAFGVR